ncbi:Rha family transcriptional regulator [Streptococcus sp. zg-JUN1979]|uniref:Rha family transcriptional regulator n=1 Tax=Streptococcus sp. zg-JUN1979 TaxID=3391450 RepID=UPI0039A60835
MTTLDKTLGSIFHTEDNDGNLLNLIELNGEAYTTSRMMAEKFNKRHDHVMRAIDEIRGGLPKSGETPNNAPMFVDSTYTHDQNKREYREVLVSKKGCLLYMFNIQGYQAEKLLFIESFERMEQQLREQTQTTTLPNDYYTEDGAERHFIDTLTRLMLEATDLNEKERLNQRLRVFMENRIYYRPSVTF